MAEGIGPKTPGNLGISFMEVEKVLNPTELDQVAACIRAILKDEERSVTRLLTSLLERRGFFLCSGGICIYKT